jgi:hypothetical protein
MKETASMAANNDNDVMKTLGLVLGELKGMRDMMDTHHTSIHRRIDDLGKANETRFKNVEDRVTKVEANHHSLLLRTAAGGGIAGCVAAVVVEIIKMKSGS